MLYQKLAQHFIDSTIYFKNLSSSSAYGRFFSAGVSSRSANSFGSFGDFVALWTGNGSSRSAHPVIVHCHRIPISNTYRSYSNGCVNAVCPHNTVCGNYHIWPAKIYSSSWIPNTVGKGLPGAPCHWVTLPSPGRYPWAITRCIYKTYRWPAPNVHNNSVGRNGMNVSRRTGNSTNIEQLIEVRYVFFVTIRFYNNSFPINFFIPNNL